MTDEFRRTAALALQELDLFREQLRNVTASAWSRPTPCVGWDIADLARHVASVAWAQAEAVHRARIGISEAPAIAAVPGDVDEIGCLVQVARDHVGSALDQLGERPDAVVPLPFAPVPSVLATQILLIEYGFHRSDLARAFNGKSMLGDEVARVALELMAGLLPIIGTRPARPVAFRLAPEGGPTTSAAWRDGEWRIGEYAGEATCEIAGPDPAVALFCYGRLGVDDPTLSVSDSELGAQFKALFPGP